MKLVASILTLVLVVSTSLAQEPDLVSEVVARVNNDIITSADYSGALRDLKEELARQMLPAGKSEAEIQAEYERIKPTILDVLIDNLLLEQKAKELSIETEAEVNQQMKQIATENKFPNVLAFEEALKKQGIDPDAARATLRKQIQHEYVIQREVLAPIYQSISEKEKRDFYEKNKDKFTVPGKVILSEVFLSLEGYTAAEVDQRARRLVAELRAGMSFAEAVQKYSPPTRPSRAQNGKLGEFLPADLKKEVAAAISTLQVGEVTEPIRLQDGFQIVRLDEQKPAVTRKYEDTEVERSIAQYMTMQRAEDARKKYLSRLRDEAYVKISENYAPPGANKSDAKPKG
jgi:parvulin-like peptidyl-prolyl isomerase